MNTYVQNYWSLYLEFIRDFESITYNGLSLSYLVHFPALIRNNPEVWKQLDTDTFAKQLTRRIDNQSKVQQLFDQYIQSQRKETRKANKSDRVLFINDQLLRIPPETLNHYFNPSKTVVVKTNQKKSPQDPSLNMPVHYVNDYLPNVNTATTHMRLQVKKLLKSYKDHHLYQKPKFQKMLFNRMSTAINQIEICNNMLKDIPASCIVISSPNHFSRVVTFVAAKRGISTICTQHGIIGNEFGYIPKIANIDAVYGQYEVDWYKALGVKEEALEITGHPRFDQAFQPSPISRATFDKSLGLNHNKKTLLVVVRGERNISKWETLLEKISASKEIKLNILLKDYPNTETHALERKFPFIKSSGSYDLYETLPHVDGVVSYPSTVGLEAMLVDKPVFIIQNRLLSYTGYFDELGELVQKDPEKLADLIIKFFYDPKWNKEVSEIRKKFIEYAYPDLGLSSERLHKLIKKFST
ncbi:CDP-glycerol glycerophosphotransferase family protein [Alkalibacillus almallahensis]|uniref:CDP-glycerol glycerophosphotransferase family protein n=1 Tax=Alkalibacillus almallahensis TaxID=1379154 RepID=UPI001423E791|nr:CDP-glycerol glycerophosphotransferase family protein [Alkalibacillus almallahensis]NIK12258.1 CDP-glycerol glycerophosphotransferase (TagB/SpsB family) [Alkalibacillus almallahensis]